MHADIRQSEQWARYLELLGWRSFRTSKSINVEVISKFGLTSAKVQRPAILDARDLDEIERICKREKCLYVKIEPSTGQDLKILEENGYEQNNEPLSPTKTLEINITKPEGTLWYSLNKGTRYSVNKAKKEGNTVEITSYSKPKTLKNVHKILKQSNRRNGIRTYPLKDLYTKVDVFGDKSFIAISRNEKGEMCGANVYLGYNENIWYMHGGTTRKGRKTNAGYLLTWESILYFQKIGYKLLDMEGIEDERFKFTKKWKGFSDFKKKFGGKQVEYPYPYVKYFSTTARVISKLFPI